MMSKVDKRNQEVVIKIRYQQKEMIAELEREATQKLKNKMPETHRLNKEVLERIWICEDACYNNMKTRLDIMLPLERLIHKKKRKKDLESVPSFTTLDELIKTHERIGELQQMRRQRLMAHLGFYDTNSLK